MPLAGLSLDACPGFCIQTPGLDEGEGNIATEAGVMGQVDLLLATFTQELLDLVAAVGKGGGF